MALRARFAGLILSFFLLSPAQAVVQELRQPAWAELTQEQKQILAPLARDWDKMEAYRKKKWLGIAKRYPAMKPEEQARIQRRIKDWVNLTPEQRSRARAQYKNLKTAPPEHKEVIKEKWDQYKDLPDEEKKRLADKATRKPPARSTISPSKHPSATLQPLPAAAVPAPPPVAAPQRKFQHLLRLRRVFPFQKVRPSRPPRQQLSRPPLPYPSSRPC